MSQTLVTLLDLDGEVRARRIRIPKLQRDFAQGRTGATRLRERFIRALRRPLDPSTATGPLDLDFIYGTTQDGTFSPLDGQQRLTTLFLLHWYLAQRDGQAAAFREQFVDEQGHSRFTYDVRPTSGEFFDALVAAELDPGQIDQISTFIRDARWYFQSWERDPTVVSCMAVLDTIHEVFGDLEGAYARLTQQTPSPVTFQFLDLDAFGLTEDLYIKMNARGKPLTVLETFKANLEQHISRHHSHLRVGEGSLGAHLGHAFDTDWADLFWKHRDTSTHSYDDQMMRCIHGVAILCWEGEEADLQALVDGKVETFYDFRAHGCLSDAFLERLVFLFNRFASTPGDLWRVSGRTDGSDLIQRVFEGRSRGSRAMTYGHWIKFVAWCEFLLSGRPMDELDARMRVVANLADNTIYNRIPEFIASLRGVRRLVAADDLHDLLCGPPGEVTGFNRQQIREERLKAQLMRRSPEWITRIITAEQHPYFQGQIEFLLSFSGVLEQWLKQGGTGWSDDEDESLRTSFDDWWTRVTAVFPDDRAVLFSHPDELWRRALLAEGDYLLPKGRNWSVLDDTDREASWKRLLRGDLRDEEANERRDLVRRLLASLDPDDVEAGLRARIAQGVSPDQEDRAEGVEHSWDWRDVLVEDPRLFSYMKNSVLRFDEDETIFLLWKSQRNGRHWDLFVTWLGLWAEDQIAEGGLKPFDTVELKRVITASERPRLTLRSSFRPELRCVVTHKNDEFRARVLEGEEVLVKKCFDGPRAKKRLRKLVEKVFGG